ncbi:MAG: hypothetical protein LBT40_09535 [Deltaproteobacteria bacterium]|jgi:hypothetical protein|nr:hypothetical protein [Deltaproteobacteria bacterium]
MTFPDIATALTALAQADAVPLAFGLLAAALTLLAGGDAAAAGRKGAGRGETGDNGTGAGKDVADVKASETGRGPESSGGAAGEARRSLIPPVRVRDFDTGEESLLFTRMFADTGTDAGESRTVRQETSVPDLMFASWPAWSFPPMGSVMEGIRLDAETMAGEGRFPVAAECWDRLRALASLAYGPGDPRVLAMLSRAGRSLLLAAEWEGDLSEWRSAGDLEDKILSGSLADTLDAACACSGGAIAGAPGPRAGAGAGIPEEERLFAEATLDGAARVAGKAGIAWRPGMPGSAPPARGVPEALWPLPGQGWSPGSGGGLPGSPLRTPGRDPGDVGRLSGVEVATCLEDGEPAVAFRYLSSRSAELLAFRASVLRTDPDSRKTAEETFRKAGIHLGMTGVTLMGLLGVDDVLTQDALARYALFLMRELGPVRVLAPSRGERPPKKDLERALSLFVAIMAASGRGSQGEGGARWTDAALRAAECHFLMDSPAMANILRDCVLMHFLNANRDHAVSEPRDLVTLYAMAESVGYRVDGSYYSADLHDIVLYGFRELLGHAHRLTVRSMCRVADMLETAFDEAREERKGRGEEEPLALKDSDLPVVASYRAMAAETLEFLARREGREGRAGLDDPDLHALRSMAAGLFVEAGDRAEALAVLEPAAEALERLAGKRDPRTKAAAKLLKEARCLKGP